ncbi:MAG: hypothetical protein ATN35_03775 [Epulopiscium sp. Nele67-Bin004]|nr:MAG: hypothetical protein ATN35_03775 [Epulopiscium sp. Nele67-Bin004]
MIEKIKQQLLDEYEQHQTAFLALGITFVLCILILLNTNVIKMQYYKYSGDTTAVLKVMNYQVSKEGESSKMYYSQGLNYLLNDMSFESRDFLEEYYLTFSEYNKEQILQNYNDRGLLIRNPIGIFEDLANGEYTTQLIRYINRLDIHDFENILIAGFGEELTMSNENIEDFYNVVRRYTTKITLENFQVSIYALLQFLSDVENSEIIELLEQINRDTIYNTLMGELKFRTVSLDDFSKWTEILNKMGCFTTQEYANFNNIYTYVNMLRQQYTSLWSQAVEAYTITALSDEETASYEAQLNTIYQIVQDIEETILEGNSRLEELGSDDPWWKYYLKSVEERDEIEEINSNIDSLYAQVGVLWTEKEQLNTAISLVRDTYDYTQNSELLTTIEGKLDDIEAEIKSQLTIIEELFNIRAVTIELK